MHAYTHASLQGKHHICSTASLGACPRPVHAAPPGPHHCCALLPALHQAPEQHATAPAQHCSAQPSLPGPHQPAQVPHTHAFTGEAGRGRVRVGRLAGRKDRYVHGSRRAPRCLPCNYTDPLEASGVGARINGFQAVKACPCNLEALCKGPSNEHIINSWDCTWSRHHPGWWYFAHGWAASCALLAWLGMARAYQALEAGLKLGVMTGCQIGTPAHDSCGSAHRARMQSLHQAARLQA